MTLGGRLEGEHDAHVLLGSVASLQHSLALPIYKDIRSIMDSQEGEVVHSGVPPCSAASTSRSRERLLQLVQHKPIALVQVFHGQGCCCLLAVSDKGGAVKQPGILCHLDAAVGGLGSSRRNGSRWEGEVLGNHLTNEGVLLPRVP